MLRRNRKEEQEGGEGGVGECSTNNKSKRVKG